jgi:hypothetical protein
MPRAEIASERAVYTLGLLHAELAGKLLANKREAIRLRTAMMQGEAVVKMLQPASTSPASQRSAATRATLGSSAGRCSGARWTCCGGLRPRDGAGDCRRAGSRQGPRGHTKAGYRLAGGYSCCPSEAERRDGGWRGSASAVAIGERLTSCAMASDRIGHHSNLLTYRVPNSSVHWPPKKTNSPSMPIAAQTVHLGHGMAMSRICAGNRPSASMEPWVRRNSHSQPKRVSVLGKVSEVKFSSARQPPGTK